MLRLHYVGSCSIYGYRRHTKRAEDSILQINRIEGHKESSRAAAFFIHFSLCLPNRKTAQAG
ncbi:hypothetical protein [Peribacillus simplex]|uniref:hypothetical protein n=1 Tax=Peribacillus simplex TaxID=1478 RepID=UPI003D2A843D